ncbi:MAG TPA: hypothetical protein DEP84_04320 [Chloroflexi bacterium]|nr:hypothetical protein [Chloroflexota bacterium]
MIGYDLCALLIDSAEDQSQTISMLEARLRFLGIAANLPREFLLGESKEQQLDDFLSYVIPMLRVAYGDRIAAHFMLPVNVIVTVRDQHQHPKTVQSFDAIEHLLQYMNLPSSLTAQLQEIRQSYVRDVGGGKPFMYQRAENTPLVKWLDTVNDHLLVKDDLETYS